MPRAHTTQPRRRRRLLALLPALGLAIAGAGPAGAAGDADPSLADAAASSIAEAHDVSRAEASARAEAQPGQLATAEQLTTTLGADAAGAWIDTDSGELVVNVLDAAAALRVAASGARAEIVDTSNAELEAAVTKLEAANPPAGAAWGIDDTANGLVVRIPAEAGVDGERFAAAAGSLDVDVTIETDVPKVATQAFFGGEAITTGGGRCSAGFIATSSSGRKYVLTAGHCTSGSGTWSGDGQTIGPAVATSFPGDDFGAIRIDNPSALDPRGAVLLNGQSYDITGSSPAAIGATVCKTGSTTGTTCGQITARNVTVNYGPSGIVRELIQSNTCSQPGDSGGALYAAGGQAQGVVSGGTIGSCSQAGFQSYYQEVGEILSVYGVTLD